MLNYKMANTVTISIWEYSSLLVGVVKVAGTFALMSMHALPKRMDWSWGTL